MKLFYWFVIMANVLWGLIMIYVGVSNYSGLTVFLGTINLSIGAYIAQRS